MTDHILTIRQPVPLPEDGLLLGNGDFSVSCFQQPGAILFQLGKNDFWDERMDYSDNPRPAHIDELRQATEEANWHCDGITGKPIFQGDASPRLRDLCRPMPSMRRSAPTPKPVATLRLHYPADWPDQRWEQTLEIERGILTVRLHSPHGGTLLVRAVVHPTLNRLTLHWRLSGVTRHNTYGGYFPGLPELPPIYATLYRRTETTLTAQAMKEYRDHGNRYFGGKELPTLPHATVQDGALCQTLPSGAPLFLALASPDAECEATDSLLRCRPSGNRRAGAFCVALSRQTPQEATGLAGSAVFRKEAEAAAQAGRRFFAHSSLHIPAAPALEEHWYACLHAKRCVLRAGVVPPGLFLPSTILHDFSQWHGDYHLNYNYQSMFLGDWEANHLDTGDAYFDGIAPAQRLGRKIARDYYGIPDACFIQLSCFPFDLPDDYMGGLPLGRMAYMTGWCAAAFHRRWRLTLDHAFLEKTAFPAVREFARFYAGFLLPGNDGLFHAFPSNQGESNFSRENCLDAPQVLQHARFTLLAASEEAEALGLGNSESAHWREIAQKLPSAANLPKQDYPEFQAFDGIIPPAPQPDSLPESLADGTKFATWYVGQAPYFWTILLRSGKWDAARYWHPMQDMLRHWRMPNGQIRAMSHATHSLERGGFTESLGFLAAITSLLLTDTEGILTLFPGVPDGQAASFQNLRADGAFLVSATRCRSGVKSLTIHAEKGGECRFVSPWNPQEIETIHLSPGETRTITAPKHA